jgi:hypothetical protein
MKVTDGITTIDLTRPQQAIDGKWYVMATEKRTRMAQVEKQGTLVPPPNVIDEQITRVGRKENK